MDQLEKNKCGCEYENKIDELDQFLGECIRSLNSIAKLECSKETYRLMRYTLIDLLNFNNALAALSKKFSEHPAIAKGREILGKDNCGCENENHAH